MIQTLFCGCIVSCLGVYDNEPRIIYCATHAAAPELLDVLRDYVEFHDAETSTISTIQMKHARFLMLARVAVRKAMEG